MILNAIVVQMESVPWVHLARIASVLCFPKRRKKSSKLLLQNVILPQQFMKETSVTRISNAFLKATADSKRALLKVANQSHSALLRAWHLICYVSHVLFSHVLRDCDIDVVAFIQASAEQTLGPYSGQTGILKNVFCPSKLTSPQGSIFRRFTLKFGHITGISEHYLENFKSPDTQSTFCIF